MANVACDNLMKRYGDVPALTDVSCRADDRGVLLILGPSGAGKTTLLRLVAGLDRPDAGTIRIGGAVVTGSGRHVPPHLRGVAFVFQRPTLWPHLRAVDNVMLALVGRRLRRRERRRRAAAALDRLGMTRRARAFPGSLSGGELQRVSLARALVTDPGVLLLDEPFASLDVELRADLVRHLAALKADRGVTMLWVSHRYEEALALADGLVLLREGRVVESGPVQDLMARPTTVFGARFLTDANLLEAVVGPDGRAETVLGAVPCPDHRPGDAVVVAVSPDAFLVDGEGDLHATIEHAEFRGRSFACTARLGGATLRIHLKDRLAAGDEVSLRLITPPVPVREE